VGVLTFAILGLATGGIYALMAQGLVITYRATGIINFAQGAVGMAGAYFFYSLWNNSGWPWPVALLLVAAMSFVFGGLIHLLVMRPLRTASPLVRMIATLGILTTLEYLFNNHYGDNALLVFSPLPSDVIHLSAGAVVTTDRLILVGIAVGVCGVLFLIYRYTTFGLTTSAVSESFQATAALGRSPDRIAVVNWGIGAVLGTVACVFIAPIAGLQAVTLSLLILPALAAALVGGFSSFRITFAVAMLLGVGQSILTGYLTSVPGLSDSLPFVVVIIFLIATGRSLPLRSELGDRLPSIGSGRLNLPLLAVGLAGGIIAFLLLSANWQFALTTSLLFALVALSLVVLVGYCGQLSLAQYMLAGMGAWIAAQSIAHLHVDFLVAAIFGVLGTVPVGLIVAIPALRARGVNLAIATLGLGAIVQDMLFSNNSLTGGIGIPIGNVHFFGINFSPITEPGRFGILVLILFVLCCVAVANLRRGSTGRRLIAVRSNERAAASLGISIFGAKLYAFAVGSAIAGLAGVFFAYQSTTVQFSSYQVLNSINAVLLATIGGIGHVVGTLWTIGLAPGGVGAQILLPFGNASQWFKTYSGVLLIVTLLVAPNGLAVSRHNQFIGDKIRKSATKLIRLIYKETGNRSRLGDSRRSIDSASQSVRVRPGRLEVKGVTVRFGGVVALDDVSIEVGPGEVVGLIGPNGAGKTTLIDAITGYVTPDVGSVRMNELDLTGRSPISRARLGIGRSFQSLELFEDLDVEENIRAAADRRQPLRYVTDLIWPRSQPISGAARAAIEELDFGGDLGRTVGDLSYGRRRLVAIARSLAAAPSVLLLDEPAAGLDEIETQELGDVISRLASDWGVGILLIEHDVNLVMRISHRVAVLDFGRCIASGTPEAIQRDPAVLAAYLGEDRGSEDGAVVGSGDIPLVGGRGSNGYE
jgi:ABC-type branched-subunit amino acid transport system ATPase component/branched-subunit amino acid ABC-type transport system permease component